MDPATTLATLKQAIAALNVAHGVGAPDVRHLFTDVYDELPWALREQQAELKQQIETYREHYAYVSEQQLDACNVRSFIRMMRSGRTVTETGVRLLTQI